MEDRLSSSMTNPSMRVPLLALLVLVCVQGFTRDGQGQRLIVETTARAAGGAYIRSYIESVDFTLGQVLPGAYPLTGPSISAPVLLPDAATLVTSAASPLTPEAIVGNVSSGAPQPFDHSYIRLFRTAPFQRRPWPDLVSAPDWRYSAVVSEGDSVVILARWHGDTLSAKGKIGLMSFAVQRSAPLLNAWWDAPGIPLAATIVTTEGAQKAVVVLCEMPYESAIVLHVRDLASGEVIREKLPINAGGGPLGIKASGLAKGGGGRYIYILNSGYAHDEPSGVPQSWFHVVETRTWKALFDPFPLTGVAQLKDGPLTPRGANECWIATRTLGTDFAHLTNIAVTESAIDRVLAQPFTGVENPLIVTQQPSGSGVAIAADKGLEIWPKGSPEGRPTFFPGPIGAMAWTDEGLFVGEAGRVHMIDIAEGGAAKTVQLQRGIVTNLVPIAARFLPEGDEDADGFSTRLEEAYNLSGTSADSDDDGLCDCSDPEPLTPSPRLEVPPWVTFHGGAVGKELQSFVIDTPHGDTASWRVEFDAEEMPWLIIRASRVTSPTAGLTSGLSGQPGTLPVMVTMGVDPTHYDPSQGLVEGTLKVYLSGVKDTRPAAGSPAEVTIRILPKEGELRRILWIWDPLDESFRHASDPHGLKALGDLLASPPFYFSHREAWAPYLGSLDPFTTVVVTARAAATGAVTRKALLDYVLAGGSLLFLGEYMPRVEDRGLRRWLMPLGLEIDVTENVSGRFASTADDERVRHWDNFEIRNGAAIRLKEGDSVLVRHGEDTDVGILMARAYGYGRMAMVSSSTPFESDALKSEHNRRFAEDLFGWLARARSERNDRDGDGLPDDVEDVNQNGFYDPGETNYLLADTDGDGIPDGAEDANRNGITDSGETNPRNADSDGDGVFDGADVYPLPPLEAPHVETLEPAEGPAEGSTQVSIAGRNFSPDTRVWFGERPASEILYVDENRLNVMSPPAPDTGPGPVAVRVANASSSLAGTLPGGYRYTERSAIRILLETLQVVHVSGSLYEGRSRIRLETPPNVMVGRMGLIVQADPRRLVRWLDVTEPRSLLARGRRSTGRETGTGGMGIIVTKGDGGAINGDIAYINWHFYVPATGAKTLKFATIRSLVGTGSGAPLAVDPVNLQLDFSHWPVRSRPLRP